MGSVTQDERVKFLMVTANVGTLFENLSSIESGWIGEFTSLLRMKVPNFIAVHFQEIGGKDVKSSMAHVDQFVKNLLSLDEFRDFNVVRGYLDEDYECVEEYTALGSFYFAHKCLGPCFIWDYDGGKFNQAVGIEVFSHDLNNRSDIRKEKFEQGYFPDCKWSRKGYTRVRWKIRSMTMEFLNIHLFHDDNNLTAVQSSPSCYSKSRRRALKFVLQRVNADPPPNGLFFCFGDFNFRLDVKALVQKLCDFTKVQVVRSKANGDVLRLIYRTPTVENDPIAEDHISLTIERKLFQCDPKLLSMNGNYEHLQVFNSESEGIDLKEFSLSFPPTYPYSETSGEGEEYMMTRCPAWCDRVLLSSDAWIWINDQGTDVAYDTVGRHVCMGDHKPTYLTFSVRDDCVTN